MLVCTERGDILFCDKDGDFKSKLIESPGNNYFISSIVPIKGEDFIITNPDGYMNFYTATKELKNPFKLEKDRLPEVVDREDNKFFDYIEQTELCPHFQVISMDMAGDWLIYTTKKK